MKKRLFSLLTTLVMVVSLVGLMPAMSVGAATSGDYVYTVLSDGTVEITKYKGSATELDIPSEIDGKTVTSIGEGAFEAEYNWDTDEYESNIQSISIPNSVTSIGDWAFSYCESLTSINIPNSVTSIGYKAFSGCKSLTSVNIPDSVTSIGEEAFAGCHSLTSVTIGNSVTGIVYWTFNCCKSLTSITIPNSVTFIGESAFGGCDSLTSITVDSNNKNYSSVNGVLFDKNKTKLIQYPIGNTRTSYSIPNGVTSIGEEAFAGCHSLTSITIPDSVTIISYIAFAECDIESITIPYSVTSIRDYAFYRCSSLKDVYYTGSEEEWNKISIGSKNSNLTNATIHFYSSGSVNTSTEYKTPTEFNNKTLSKYSFFSNLYNDSDSFAIPGVITTNLGSTNCDFMTPQGICKAGDYILISAYCGANNKNPQTVAENLEEHKSHKSVLYVLNATTHKYLTTIVLRDKSHVGGLAYDSKNNIVWIAKSSKDMTKNALDGISLDIISVLATNGSDADVISENSYAVTSDNAKVNVKASYLTYYNSMIWVGDNENSNFAGYTVNDDYSLTQVTSTTSFPMGVSDTNGMTFYDKNGKTYMGISSSYGRFKSSTLYTYEVDLSNLNNIKFSKKAAHTMPNMTEEIEIIDNNAYLNFESASSAYFNLNKSSGLYPTDRICSLDAYSLFKSTIDSLIKGSWVCLFNNLNLNKRSVKSVKTVSGNKATISSYLGDDVNVEVPSQITSDNTTYSVTGIGTKTFEGLNNTTSISIPASVTNIETGAVSDCANLTSISVDSDNPNYSSVDGILYNKDKTELIYSPQNSNKSDIPDTVTTISDSAFIDSNISYVNIPNSVTEIGNIAFMNCTNLKDITIPKSVETIGNGAIGYTYDSENEAEEKVEDFKIYCYEDTAGEQYAIENGFDYELLDKTLQGNVYHQTKTTDEETALRFVAELDEEDILNAESGSYTISVNDNDLTNEIKKVYKSIYVNGKKTSAPEGKYYVATFAVDRYDSGDKITSEFNLSNYIYGLKKEIVV